MNDYKHGCKSGRKEEILDFSLRERERRLLPITDSQNPPETYESWACEQYHKNQIPFFKMYAS